MQVNKFLCPQKGTPTIFPTHDIATIAPPDESLFILGGSASPLARHSSFLLTMSQLKQLLHGFGLCSLSSSS